VEGRREARIWAAALLAAQLLLDLTADLVFGLDWRPRAFAVAQNAAILAFTVGMIWQLLRAGAERVSHGPIPAGPIGDAEAGAGLAERLRVLIEVERLHLDPGMTFDAFVRRMGAPERAVRQLINHRLGHDHFRTFLNAHRMAEARRLLADPRRSGDKLIAIALDSGFASLASFNRVFREA
jgi:AraC-like DNA-binding protein